jgi:glycosyltransferase involved in cell wall biosynthesis
MRILFLNQYFPPDPAPTGVLLREVADELERAGHTVDFVAARQDYRATQQKRGRMVRELKALMRMLIDAARKPRADVVVSASSPPCLAVVATLVAMRHGARHVHWVMDLYPEIAVALGEVRGGVLPGMIERLMGWCYRRAARVLALDDDMAARLRRHGVECAIIRPWVFAPVLKTLASVRGEAGPEWTWIYSGNLGRAHEWETLLQAQVLLEARGAGIRLLFQGGGPSWPAARSRGEQLGLKLCTWTGYVDEEDLPASLLRCHALVVTQLPAVRGMLWPSKLGLVMSLPRPIAWVGPADGAIANELRSFAHAGIFSPGQSHEIADWLMDRKRLGESVSPSAALDAAVHRTRALASWKEIIEAL